MSLSFALEASPWLIAANENRNTLAQLARTASTISKPCQGHQHGSWELRTVDLRDSGICFHFGYQPSKDLIELIQWMCSLRNPIKL
jgi:hypothetical protein